MRLLALFLLALALAAQRGGVPPERQKEDDFRLPSGKSQKQEILKADYEKSRAEAADLIELARQLKEEIEKNQHHVLNLKTLKKAEEIEKLARRIKDRLRRY